MTSPHLKAVIFDIGGVVVRSPMLAIAAFEKETGLPPNYINCSITRRGPNGSWQRFERGEMSLFPFYDAFGKELSDSANGNIWYAEYCQRRGIECPQLPARIGIDGRELFGRMMRESAAYDDSMVEAIKRIKAAKRWRVIALTNNYSKVDKSIGEAPPSPERFPDFTRENELAFLGWTEGATSAHMRELFDDFCDSSELGMRKPDPEFYLLACKRNGVEPRECVFLDDIGMNLKTAQQLGMETIHVPIGGSLEAIQKLETKLGINLTGLPGNQSRL